jgi:hypothetical protein
MLNWCYTVAVFTDPGSPLTPPNTSSGNRHTYSHLPTHEPPTATSFTVKSTGETRFCKKCQARKPDRTHHCSTCRKCVLKMDHHCPWLATCVGLRNYKAFLLFCIYTTLFCWICFALSASFLYNEISSIAQEQFGSGFLSINMVLLAVLAGILGLVLSGFTGWHISLAIRNQTTIECLEKTRYLSPLKNTLQRAQNNMPSDPEAGMLARTGQQLAAIHANAIPGVTGAEEGNDHPSPGPNETNMERHMTAQEALNSLNWNEVQRERERERYEDYLNEKDSEKLPNAFDLGWQRNLTLLFGENKWLRALPICNSIGDGWHWEASPKWLAKREEIRRERQSQWQAHEHGGQARTANGGNVAQQYRYDDVAFDDDDGSNEQSRFLTTSKGVASVPNGGGRRSPYKADAVLGRVGQYADGGVGSPGEQVSLRTLQPRQRGVDESSLDGIYDGNDGDEGFYEMSSDEERAKNGDWNGQEDKERGEREGGDDEWREWD